MSQSEEIREQIRVLVKAYYEAKHRKAEFVPGVSRVHYAGRVFDDAELGNLVDAGLDFWLTAGRFSRDFESSFAQRLGTTDAILVNSGSSANLVALSSLCSPSLGDRRLQPGDEVIAAASSFPSTVSPIVQCNLIPVFVDVALGTYNAIPERITQAIGPKTRAIMLAHTMGNPFDLGEVMRLAREHGLWVIEDTCDALGSRYDNQLVGTFGDFSTYSFYPAHHITMGEGGCIATSNPVLARAARSIRDWGRDCYCNSGRNNTCAKRFSQQFGTLPMGYDHRYVYSHIGYNLQITDMQAAVGCAQLEKLDGFIEARKANWRRLREALTPYEPWLVLPEATPRSDPSWFGFVISVREDAGFTRAELVAHIEKKKIETRNLFAGNLLRHPAFQDITCRIPDSLENSDRVTEQTFFVGCYPGLRPEELDYMISVFQSFFDARA